MKKLEKVIAREGLILIGIAMILYLCVTFLFQNLPVVFPKYRAVFTNGQAYIIDIYPELGYAKVLNPKVFLREIHNPSSQLISQRIKEFTQKAKINSALKEAKPINKAQLYFSGVLSVFLSLNLLLKTLSIYIFLLPIRFIIWALRTLRER